MILALLLLAVSSAAFSLPFPRPIQGSPMIMAKHQQIGCGRSTYEFQLPDGWGIGEMTTSAETGSGHFTLFPVNSGPGCTVDVRRFQSEEMLQGELSKLRLTFSGAQDLAHGFEAEASTGWYAAQTQGLHLVEWWYVVGKKTAAARRTWSALKESLRIHEEPAGDEASEKALPLFEKTRTGYTFHEPNGQLHLCFDTFLAKSCVPNDDLGRAHALRFQDFYWDGFLFIRWKQERLDEMAPFRAHLDEMLADIRKGTPEQKVYGEPEFHGAGCSTLDIYSKLYISYQHE